MLGSLECREEAGPSTSVSGGGPALMSPDAEPAGLGGLSTRDPRASVYLGGPALGTTPPPPPICSFRHRVQSAQNKMDRPRAKRGRATSLRADLPKLLARTLLRQAWPTLRVI